MNRSKCNASSTMSADAVKSYAPDLARACQISAHNGARFLRVAARMDRNSRVQNFEHMRAPSVPLSPASIASVTAPDITHPPSSPTLRSAATFSVPSSPRNLSLRIPLARTPGGSSPSCRQCDAVASSDVALSTSRAASAERRRPATRWSSTCCDGRVEGDKTRMPVPLAPRHSRHHVHTDRMARPPAAPSPLCRRRFAIPTPMFVSLAGSPSVASVSAPE